MNGTVASPPAAVVRFLFFFVNDCFCPQVRQFYLQQQKRRETLEARDQERLANLRSLMEDQARRDKER